MTIKVTHCSKPDYWYKDWIGEEFETLKWEDHDVSPDPDRYLVRLRFFNGKPKKSTLGSILKTDVQIIN